MRVTDATEFVVAETAAIRFTLTTRWVSLRSTHPAAAASPPAQAQSAIRAAAKQHDGQITQKSVKPVWKKYSDFPKSQISLCSARLTR
jgi:hypothetical protein